MAWVRGLGKGNEKNLPILYDPQTSGGLLISLPEEAARQLVDELRSRGHPASTIVGRVIEKDIDRAEGGVIITNTRLTNIVGSPGPNLLAQKDAMALTAETALAEAMPSALPASADAIASMRSQPPAASPVETELACCAGGGDTTAFIAGPITTGDQELADRKPDAPASSPVVELRAAEAGEAFMAFLKRANQPGGIDQRTKKLMAIALSVAQRCESCLRTHLKSAQEMGLTKKDIDEAAWLAIGFGGSPAMVLYQEISRKLRL